jgi:hypothetical protein
MKRHFGVKLSMSLFLFFILAHRLSAVNVEAPDFTGENKALNLTATAGETPAGTGKIADFQAGFEFCLGAAFPAMKKLNAEIEKINSDAFNAGNNGEVDYAFLSIPWRFDLYTIFNAGFLGYSGLYIRAESLYIIYKRQGNQT